MEITLKLVGLSREAGGSLPDICFSCKKGQGIDFCWQDTPASSLPCQSPRVPSVRLILLHTHFEGTLFLLLILNTFSNAEKTVRWEMPWLPLVHSMVWDNQGNSESFLYFTQKWHVMLNYSYTGAVDHI